MKNSTFSYEIKQHVAVLSTDTKDSITKEVNIICYNNAPTYKLDIRSWGRDKDGNRILLKGITLNSKEATILRDALNKLNY